MMTFVTVMLAILAANVIWTVGVYAIMGTEKFQNWMMKITMKWTDGYVAKLEEKYDEEGL